MRLRILPIFLLQRFPISVKRKYCDKNSDNARKQKKKNVYKKVKKNIDRCSRGNLVGAIFNMVQERHSRLSINSQDDEPSVSLSTSSIVNPEGAIT